MYPKAHSAFASATVTIQLFAHALSVSRLMCAVNFSLDISHSLDLLLLLLGCEYTDLVSRETKVFRTSLAHIDATAHAI